MDPEAQFWMMKYFELLSHSTQVATKLAAPALRPAMQAQADRMREAHSNNGVSA